VLSSSEFDGMVADIWSLGVTLFLIVTGVPPLEVAHADRDKRFPFSSPSHSILIHSHHHLCLCVCDSGSRFQHIRDGLLFDLMQRWGIDYLSAELRHLLFHMLQADWRERITLRDILTHPWVVGEVGEVEVLEEEGVD